MEWEMTKKQSILLPALILLVPVETLIAAIVFPWALIGGFGGIAFGFVVLHLMAFADYNDRKGVTKLPVSFIIAFAIGAIAISLISIEFIYARIPESVRIWN